MQIILSKNLKKNVVLLQNVETEPSTRITINIHVLSIFIFKFGIIPFRAVPRILQIIFDTFGLALNICHFTSVINWSLKLGLYKLNNIRSWQHPWTAIVDASIKWGNKKMLVILRVPTHIMKDHLGALTLNDVEVVGIYIREVINGEVVSKLLGEVFSKIGNPIQILTDGGSDLAKGIRMQIESFTTNCVHNLDIGHFAANILKQIYIKNEQFKKLISFSSHIGSKLRQTVAAWLVPPVLRVKARFQSISELAKWAQKVFTYCNEQLENCDEKLKKLLTENLNGHEYLLKFSQMFSQDCSAINDVLKIIKNAGLSLDTYNKAMNILSSLLPTSQIRIQLEEYLTENYIILKNNGISVGLVSTDIIESLFGKIKYIIEQSPTKDFNKLSLLLPGLVGQTDESLINHAIKEVKMNDIKKWEKENIGKTILMKKREEFKKIKQLKDVKEMVPNDAEFHEAAMV